MMPTYNLLCVCIILNEVITGKLRKQGDIDVYRASEIRPAPNNKQQRQAVSRFPC